MKLSNDSLTDILKIVRTKQNIENNGTKDEITVYITGRFDVANSGKIYKHLSLLIKNENPAAVIIDLQKLSYIDDFGVMVILDLKKMMGARNSSLTIINTNDKTKSLIFSINFRMDIRHRRPKKSRLIRLFLRLGESAINLVTSIKYMISFIGSVLFAFLQIFARPKSLRIGDTLSCMEKTGADALPIVGLISFLIGLIMAFMSSLQLQQFGAGIWVASLVSLTMVSELGPIMTAIVVAGRSGSAFAAEIGTMRISEEIDALFTMGFNPTLFLAVPRILACLIVVPILTLFSDLFAIAGGLVVGVFMLKLSAGSYLAQTFSTLTLFEVLWGMSKSAVFALLISWISCLRGFQAKGGASSVGNAATSAVVSSIFLIILFDSIFAVIRSYW